VGYEVLRFSYWDVVNEPHKVITLVRKLLVERAGQPRAA
jgi:very-short-patch-repair endonuclease